MFSTLSKTSRAAVVGILAAILLAPSCAKEIYTDKDAARARHEAQKTGLTVMIRDIGTENTDLSGFQISTTQCGETITATTTAEGVADLMITQGDLVLNIVKRGYAAATAIVTTRPDTESSRTNTVVIIPVFAGDDIPGDISGTVSVQTESTEEPLSDALVSINIDMDELLQTAFPGLTGSIDRYRPAALAYATAGLMQPVRTTTTGAFRIAIPATAASLTYTINVHETAWTHGTFCSASQTVSSNGRNHPEVSLQLTPYEK